MELNKVYYRLVFNNKQEFFVESQFEKDTDFLKSINNEYIKLQLKEGDPVYIKASQLFLSQRIRESIIGAQSKIWRILK